MIRQVLTSNNNRGDGNDAHLRAQQRFLPDERVIRRKPDHADHDEQDVFADVALAEVRAAARRVHADGHPVHIACGAFFYNAQRCSLSTTPSAMARLAAA